MDMQRYTLEDVRALIPPEMMASARPPSPGRIIERELAARGQALYDLSKRIGLPLHDVELVIDGHAKVTPEMAQRLAGVFGTSAELWINLEENT